MSINYPGMSKNNPVHHWDLWTFSDIYSGVPSTHLHSLSPVAVRWAYLLLSCPSPASPQTCPSTCSISFNRRLICFSDRFVSPFNS